MAATSESAGARTSSEPSARLQTSMSESATGLGRTLPLHLRARRQARRSIGWMDEGRDLRRAWTGAPTRSYPLARERREGGRAMRVSKCERNVRAERGIAVMACSRVSAGAALTLALIIPAAAVLAAPARQLSHIATWSWSQPASLRVTFPDTQINAISCPTATFCMAVDRYTPSSGGADGGASTRRLPPR